MTVAAFVAWVIAVAPAGFSRGAPILATVLAVTSAAAGLGGPWFLTRKPKLARHIGISLFVGTAVLSWLVNSAPIHPLRLDPLRGAFGAIAWGVFTLAWSDRWSSTSKTVPPEPNAPALLARATLPRWASGIAAFGIAIGLGYVVLAFFVRDPDRALGAQAIALGCAIALVGAAATVATGRGRPRSSVGRRLTSTAARALLFLVTFAVVGALISVLR